MNKPPPGAVHRRICLPDHECTPARGAGDSGGLWVLAWWGRGGELLDIVLPFGKHRGVSLGEIPTHYLLWVHFECDFQAACGLAPYQWVIPHVRLELIRRLGNSGVETLQAAYQPQVLPFVLSLTQAERWADGLARLRETSLKAFRAPRHDPSPSPSPGNAPE